MTREEVMAESIKVQEQINDLISFCKKNGGFVFLVDKRQNNFVLRLNEDVKLSIFIPQERRSKDV